MSTWVPTAGRTVQRGCEPRAIEAPPKSTEDDSSVRDIGTGPIFFNNTWDSALFAVSFVAQYRRRLGAEGAPGTGKTKRSGGRYREAEEPQQRTGEEHELHVQRPFYQAEGRGGADRSGDDRGGQREQPIFGEK